MYLPKKPSLVKDILIAVCVIALIVLFFVGAVTYRPPNTGEAVSLLTDTGIAIAASVWCIRRLILYRGRRQRYAYLKACADAQIELQDEITALTDRLASRPGYQIIEAGFRDDVGTIKIVRSPYGCDTYLVDQREHLYNPQSMRDDVLVFTRHYVVHPGHEMIATVECHATRYYGDDSQNISTMLPVSPNAGWSKKWVGMVRKYWQERKLEKVFGLAELANADDLGLLLSRLQEVEVR